MTATLTTAYNETERLEIQRAYRLLLKSFKMKLDDADKKSIRRAYEMAVDAHSKQRRKSGEPYILHPIEVARICADEIGLGATSVVAALLHDVVEDTKIPLSEIKTQFGDKVAQLVDGLTKLDSDTNIESPQAENLKRIIGTLITDARIIFIKMADRLHNMRTLGSMPHNKQLKIAAETEFIYAPLAHRLGLYQIKSELMDLCLKITHRQEYNEIAENLNETKLTRENYIQSFIEPLREQLDRIGFPYRISGRPKSIYSIWNKLKQKSFEEIYDLFAIRIIIDAPLKDEKSVCWQAYGIVTTVHKPIADRLKDWITIPKSNGYESLHTTVSGPEGRFVEVQIRTERMDEIAERGYAAHWKYKGIREQKDVFEHWFTNIREMIEKPNQGATSIEFMTDFIDTNLFAEEVYIYTPKGDLKIMPKGATALDFAFDIHTDIGARANAIKVNGKIVQMSYKLQNGDQVKVETNKTRKPSEDWLKWVITAKARDKIRQSLREDIRERADMGKEMLQRKLDHLKVDFESSVELLVKHFGYKTRIEFFDAIEQETIDLQDDLKIFNVERNRLVLAMEEKAAPVITERKVPVKPDMKIELLINGQSANQYNYTLSECCKPVQGDDIFAYVSAGNQLKIHRTNCQNAQNLMTYYGYRILSASWGATVNASYIAELIITGLDNGPGVIERLSNKISTQMGLNIRAFSIEGNDGYFEGRVKLVVTHRDQLVLAIKSLKSLAGVSNVIRVE